MKKALFCAVAVFMAVALPVSFSVSVLCAEQGGKEGKMCCGMEEKGGMMFDKLGLSEDQKKQVSDAKNQFMAESQRLEKELQIKELELSLELDKPAVDKAKIDSITAETKSINAAIIDNKVAKMLKMKEILTPEQYLKLSQMKGHKEKGKCCGKCGKEMKGSKKMQDKGATEGKK